VTVTVREERDLSHLVDNAKTLSEFGLTPNQAKVYLAAVELGLASVSGISRLSKVRREEVYRIMPSLERAGLIDRVLGEPIRVRALPVEEALSLLIKREKEKANVRLSALTARKGELLRGFRTVNLKRAVLEEEKAHFVLVQEKGAVASRCASMMRSAKKEIDIAHSRENVSYIVSNHAKVLKRSASKGAKVRIITEPPEDVDTLPVTIERFIPENSFILRYSEDLTSYYMIVDSMEAIVTTTLGAAPAENPSLWTNDISLISLLQRNFEDLFHVSLDWKTLVYTPAEKIIRLVSRLGPRDHVILVYNSPETKHNVLFTYLRHGLQKGEAAMYVCCEEDPSQLEDAMRRFGIEVEELKRKGALKVLDYTDFYIVNGKFDKSRVMGLWKKAYREALEKGFNGLRVTGETACFLKHNMTQELVEYEEALHRVLDIPMAAICAYNADILARVNDPVNVYSELVKAHGTVLFTGTDKELGRIEVRKH